jgi:hypothetical protein
MIGGSSAKIYLWIILNNLADIHTGIVEASLSDLATATRIDKTKVRRLLQAFLAEGLITIEKSFNRHTKTKITIGALKWPYPESQGDGFWRIGLSLTK